MQKGSFGYYLEVIFQEVAYKTSSSCLKIDFRGAGKIRRKHPEKASMLICWKLPEEIRARFYVVLIGEQNVSLDARISSGSFQRMHEIFLSSTTN